MGLSLEMFERDTQVVFDEYLTGLITEKHFLESWRAWNNYFQDYKQPLLLAKGIGSFGGGNVVNQIIGYTHFSLANPSMSTKNQNEKNSIDVSDRLTRKPNVRDFSSSG